MAMDRPFAGDQPSKYSLLTPSEKTNDLGAGAGLSWRSQPSQLGTSSSFISTEDLSRQPDSYMIVPHAPIEPKPLPTNTKQIMKWWRITLLLLRICTWLGVAGLLVCIICIRTMGTAMDWFMRIPPPAALVHLTYAIYHLSRPIKNRDPSSSGSYMICAAILDVCLIPFQALLAILARSQLSGPLDDGTQVWTTIFEAGSRSHIIVYSTFLISIVTGGLVLVSFCICVYLATRFRKIARLPPYMNPFEDNLTTRGHHKAKTSVSTTTSKETQELPDISNTAAEHVGNPNYIRLEPRPQSKFNVNIPNDTRFQLKHILPSLPGSKSVVYSALSEDAEDWTSHPPEFRHLRQSTFQPKKPSLASPSARGKYDFTNRSPRPLGLHPPTPRQDKFEGGKGFDVRALRNIDGNHSARRKQGPMWEDVVLDSDAENHPPDQGTGKKRYGDIVGMGRVIRNKARVISSGLDRPMHHGMEVRMREVSGKAAEEGRAGYHYTDF